MTGVKEVFSQLLRYFPQGEEGLLHKNLNLFAQACLAAGEFAQAQTYADMLLAQEPDDEQKMAACRIRLYVKLQCRNDKEFVHCPAFSKEQPEYLEWLTASSFDAQPMAELIGLADKNLRTVAQDRAAEEKRKQDEEQRRLSQEAEEEKRRQEEEQRRQQEEAHRIQEEKQRRQEEEQLRQKHLEEKRERSRSKLLIAMVVFLAVVLAAGTIALLSFVGANYWGEEAYYDTPWWVGIVLFLLLLLNGGACWLFYELAVPLLRLFGGEADILAVLGMLFYGGLAVFSLIFLIGSGFLG